MRIKIRDSHLICEVASKCLNICERMEVVEWDKRWFPPFPCRPVNRQCLLRKSLQLVSDKTDLFKTWIHIGVGITPLPLAPTKPTCLPKPFNKETNCSTKLWSGSFCKKILWMCWKKYFSDDSLYVFTCLSIFEVKIKNYNSKRIVKNTTNYSFVQQHTKKW